MFRSKVLRRMGVGAIALVSLGAVLLGSTAATAAPPAGTLGTLTNIPATGSDLIAPKVHTSAGCDPAADQYNLFVTGPGAFATAGGGLGYLQVSSAVNLSTTAGFDVQFGVSMKDAAADLGTSLVAGEYDLRLECVDSFSGQVFGTFTGALYFTSPTAYQSVDPNAPVTTTTSLAAAPAGPVTQGTSVTLTATVAPGSATGTVQFKDGAANLGAPVTVAGGQAQLVTNALTAGTHSLTAVFTGSAPNIQGSTSAAVTYQVNAAVATPTTTALSVNPNGSVVQYTTVTLNATVAPAAAGTIQFTDNGANLGSPVAVVGGAAALSTSTLGVGAHSFTAKFAPADAAAFVASESGAVPLAVTAFTGVTASEDIQTTVLAGALVISVADTTTVVLPSPVLLPDGSMLTTAGTLHTVTVVDTRAGNPGWNVSGQVTDFSDGVSHTINGANLGWTPKVVDQVAAQNVAAGPVVNPAAAIAPGAAAPAGVGLAQSRTLATAAPLGGNGTAHLTADVALNVPTSTVAGTYTATLTLTAI